MTSLTLTFDTDDPKLRAMLAEVGRMPRGPARLRVEAGLCRWWADKGLEQAGGMDAIDRRDRDRAARAATTRAARRAYDSEARP